MQNLNIRPNNLFQRVFDLLKKSVRRLIIYTTMNIDHHKYKVCRLWYFGGFSPSEQQDSELLDNVLKAILRYKSGVVIDVGANMGQTLVRVLSIDRHRDYVGFEPNVMCCFYVEHFIRMNYLSNCWILPVGLSNKFGAVKLLTREGDTSTGSIVEGFRPSAFYSNSQYVYVAQGDVVISDLGLSSISVIKIDVEGGELEVLKGLRNTIARYKPFVIFEVLPHYLAITKESLDMKTVEFRTKRIRQIEEFFKGEGYSIFQIQPDRVLKKLSRIDPEETPDLSKSDYLAIPSNEENEFLNLSGFNVA